MRLIEPRMLRTAGAACALGAVLALVFPLLAEARRIARDAVDAAPPVPRLGDILPDSVASTGPPVNVAMFVESTPPGAALIVNGTARGKTPAALTLACAAGAPVQVTIELERHAPYRTDAACTPGATVRVQAALTPLSR